MSAWAKKWLKGGVEIRMLPRTGSSRVSWHGAQCRWENPPTTLGKLTHTQRRTVMLGLTQPALELTSIRLIQGCLLYRSHSSDHSGDVSSITYSI